MLNIRGHVSSLSCTKSPEIVEDIANVLAHTSRLRSRKTVLCLTVRTFEPVEEATIINRLGMIDP
ncbi:hypothetical protein BHM03_00034460 [Ensete ventricosum]|nr:hypothetical protein BHM03_00034460 [Ensete ventricosum]